MNNGTSQSNCNNYEKFRAKSAPAINIEAQFTFTMEYGHMNTGAPGKSNSRMSANIEESNTKEKEYKKGIEVHELNDDCITIRINNFGSLKIKINKTAQDSCELSQCNNEIGNSSVSILNHSRESTNNVEPSMRNADLTSAMTDYHIAFGDFNSPRKKITDEMLVPLAYGDTLNEKNSLIEVREQYRKEADKRRESSAPTSRGIPFATVRNSEPPPQMNQSIPFPNQDNVVTLEIQPEFVNPCGGPGCLARNTDRAERTDTSINTTQSYMPPLCHEKAAGNWTPHLTIFAAALLVFFGVVGVGIMLFLFQGPRTSDVYKASIIPSPPQTEKHLPSLTEKMLTKEKLVALPSQFESLQSAVSSPHTNIKNAPFQTHVSAAENSKQRNLRLEDLSKKRHKPTKNLTRKLPQKQHNSSSIKETSNASTPSLKEAIPPKKEPGDIPNTSMPKDLRDDKSALGLIPLRPSRMDVIKVMADIAPYVRNCKFDKSGKVVVRLVVSGENGRVISAQAVDDVFVGTPTGVCVARVTSSIELPVFRRETIVIKYPFEI